MTVVVIIIVEYDVCFLKSTDEALVVVLSLLLLATIEGLEQVLQFSEHVDLAILLFGIYSIVREDLTPQSLAMK